MKRSRTARLVLMGLSPLALTACEGGQEALVYQSVDECAAGGVVAKPSASGLDLAHRGQTNSRKSQPRRLRGRLARRRLSGPRFAGLFMPSYGVPDRARFRRPWLLPRRVSPPHWRLDHDWRFRRPPDRQSHRRSCRGQAAALHHATRAGFGSRAASRGLGGLLQRIALAERGDGANRGALRSFPPSGEPYGCSRITRSRSSRSSATIRIPPSAARDGHGAVEEVSPSDALMRGWLFGRFREVVRRSWTPSCPPLTAA